MSIMLETGDESRSAVILNAAFRTFVDYGFKRTTMDDIAKAAGMSRPALYLVYKNKKDIFRGCISAMLQTVKLQLDSIVAKASSPEESVYAVLEAGVVGPFHILADTTHGPELFDVKSELAEDLFDDWIAMLEEAITAILEKTQAQGRLDLSATNMEPAQIAAVIVDGAEGIKLRMTEAGRIEDKIKALVSLILRPLSR